MKALFTYILVFFVLAFSCFSAAELNVTSFSDISSDFNKGLVVGSFNVKNFGNDTATGVSFSGNFVNSTGNVPVTYLLSNVDFAAGEEKEINYSIDVNPYIKAGTYLLSLSVSGGASLLGGDKESILTINSFKNMSYTVSPSGVTVAKGFSKNLLLAAVNRGNDAALVTYQVLSNSIGVDSSLKNFTLDKGYGFVSGINVPISVASSAAVNMYNLTLQVCFESVCGDTLFIVDVVDPSVSVSASGSSEAQSVDLASTNSYTFTVTNQGTAPTNINVSLSGLSDVFENINYTPKSFTLGGGASQTVTVNIDNSDEDERPLDTSYDEEYVGTFKVTDGRNTTSYSLKLKTKTEIDIDSSSFLVYLNGVKKSKSLKVKPGDEVEVKFDLKNLYSRDDDVVISDYTVNAYIENIDDGDDLELPEFSGGEISKNSDDTVTLSFTVPYVSDRANYDMIIEVEAYDENDNLFFDTDNSVSITLDKESHGLIFENLRLDSDIITCEYPTLRYTGRIVNIGRSDEDNVVVSSEILGVSNVKASSKASIDESSYNTISEIFDLSSVKSGKYTLKISAEYGSETLTESLDFRVDCNENTDVVIPDQGTNTPIVPQNNSFSDISTVDDTEPSESLFNKDTTYVVVLLILIIVVFAAIIFLLVKLVKMM